MKKLFIVLAVASLGFVACNNDSDKKEGETVDSAALKAKQDSIDNAAKMAQDSIDAAAAKAKDSVGAAAKDSVK
jgi:uncharacterized lipoprotein NlpE involved in copper resistance